jgi:hypothetical protein
MSIHLLTFLVCFSLRHHKDTATAMANVLTTSNNITSDSATSDDIISDNTTSLNDLVINSTKRVIDGKAGLQNDVIVSQNDVTNSSIHLTKHVNNSTKCREAHPQSDLTNATINDNNSTIDINNSSTKRVIPDIIGGLQSDVTNTTVHVKNSTTKRREAQPQSDLTNSTTNVNYSTTTKRVITDVGLQSNVTNSSTKRTEAGLQSDVTNSSKRIITDVHLQSDVTTNSTAKHVIKIGILLLFQCDRLFCLYKVKPAIDFVLEKVRRRQLIGENYEIIVDYNDTRCDGPWGPLAAFHFYTQSVDVFIGPTCDYSLAAVAR